MPNLGFSELLIILVLALVVFGPKRLPDIGKSIGKGLREFRKASAEMRAELDIADEPPTVPSPAEKARRAAAAEKADEDAKGEHVEP